MKIHYLFITALILILSCDASEHDPTKLREKESANFIEDEKNTINVFQNNVKSVVNVSNIRLSRLRWFDMHATEIPRGAGSGFVWDNEGHIVTNYHVIMDGDTFLISFHGDKEQYRAELIGAEPRQDIAVLKLKESPEKLHPVTMGDTQHLFVGQKAMAIGNPFGLDHTITSGIVSAVDRQIPGIGDVTIRGMIQTDAPINPGSSGGPLLDSQGRIIGMNTLIFSRSGTSAGVGFAVPSDSILRIVPQIIEHGKVVRPGLGVAILPHYHRSRFGVEEGIVITAIDSDSPAYKAGLRGMSRDNQGRHQLGDVIIGINDKKIDTFDDIYHALSNYEVGDKVTVKFRRGDEEKVRKAKVELTAL